MIELVKAKAAELLKDKKAQGFLALRKHDGHVGPYLFTRPGELEDLSLGDVDRPGDARYPLVKILRPLMEAEPTAKFALLVRGCDERALEKNYGLSIYLQGRIIPVGFPCPPELAKACECAKPWPDASVARPLADGVAPERLSGDILSQLEEWFSTFDRCVMCFGCRNTCPVCTCHECTCQEEIFIPQRELPTSRNFLMTRAMHMVDRCVYCGLCEAACPADIPLKSLYRLVAKAAGQEYRPGLAVVPGGPKVDQATQSGDQGA